MRLTYPPASLARAGRVLIPILAVALVAALAGPVPASAANTTADQARALDVRSPAASDTLVGNTGGAYRYYRVQYQGGNAPVLFSLVYQPTWGTGNQLFGFNLYGPSGLTFAGQVTNITGNTATAEYNLVNGAAMSVLVQVYNYSDAGSVSYTLTVSGLSGGSATTIIAQHNATPDQAMPVSTVNTSIGGSIVGASAGAYEYYTLRYPGGDAPLAISMNASPVYTGSGQAVGFNVYRPLPNGTVSLVATGTVTAQDTNSATISATVNQRSATDYQLQVYNYWPGASVSYGVTATGLAGAVSAASGNEDSGHAVVLNSARPGATQTLRGNRGGAYDFFLVTYPGNNSAFALSITYQATGGATPDALGFKVYDGASLVATASASDDGAGVVSGTWSYQDPNAKTFGIQVFNYAQDANAAYLLYQVGAQ
jgi:hypothetical protein